MAQNAITITINNRTEIYPEGTTYQKIAADHQKELSYTIVLAKANGRLRELNKTAESGHLEFLTLQSKAGNDTYRRSLVMLMLKAFYHVVGDNSNIKKIGIHYCVSSGYYCTYEGKPELNQSLIDQVKAYMQELAESGIPITKKAENTYEARSRFKSYGMYDKEALFRYRRASKVNVYAMGSFEDYFYGYMLPDTSYLRLFDLKLFEDGFVLQFPLTSDPAHLPQFKPEQKIFQVQKDSMVWGERLGIPTVGTLNDYIVEKKVKDLIMIQEAFHEKKIAEMAAEIASDPEKKIVLIAGPSSSGKTTFSHRLTTQLSVFGLKPHPVAADDYFVNRESTPLDEDGKPNYECIEAIDVEQLNRDMTALLSGKTVELPSFNFKTGKREYKGNFCTLGENDILIIEGIHCLNDYLTHKLPQKNKYKIYISALTQLNIDEHNRIPTTDGRLLRRLVRDARTRGADATQTIAMWPSVRRGEEENIFPYQEEADVMFNSALIYELAVLKQYAEPLLFSIKEDQPEYEEAKRLLKFLDYFLPIPSDSIPNNSLVREFIGGGCFDL